MAEANKELWLIRHTRLQRAFAFHHATDFFWVAKKKKQEASSTSFPTSIAAAKESTLDAEVAKLDGLFQMRKERTAELKDFEGVEDASALLSAVFDESLAK